MKQAIIRSVCECQSALEAVLDEQRFVLAGFAIGPDRTRERAPAHSIEAQRKRFDVAWLCPVCGRNTLRSFDAGGLAWQDGSPPAPGATPPVQPPRAPGPGPATIGSTAMGRAAGSPFAAGSNPPRPPNIAATPSHKSFATAPKPAAIPPKRPEPPKTGG
ncbi:MAG TPA: hypothetical protein VF881_07090 [Polyangiaceae bacterium]